MLLSIIVPVYKTEVYLATCLESICEQLDGVSSFEIWVVDDGSPDDSISIIRKFKGKYPGVIHVIRKENGGLSDARNAALDHARGEFIWFVDSDDSIDPNCLSEVLLILNETKADYLIFDALQVDKNGSAIGEFRNAHPKRPISSVPFTAENVRRYFGQHMVWMRLFRRKWIGDLRFPVGITHEDIHFDLQLLVREPLIQFIRQTWYRHFFENPQSITNTMNAKKFREVLWVYRDLKERFREWYALDGRYSEYLQLGVTDLLGRAKYMLRTPLHMKERFVLFREYADEISSFLEALGRLGKHAPSARNPDRLILRLIAGRHFALAYAAARAGNAAKTAYDELGRRTYRMRHGLRKMYEI